MILDESFNINSTFTSFTGDFSGYYKSDDIAIIENNIFISYSYHYYFNEVYLFSQTMINKLDLNMIPESCQPYTQIPDNKNYTEIIFGTDSSSDSYYNVETSNVSTFSYNNSQRSIYSNALTNLIEIIVSDWIWPRYDTNFQSWAYSTPVSKLNPKYEYGVGKYFYYYIELRLL